MDDWLGGSFAAGSTGVMTLAARLVSAIACGLLVAVIYRRTRGSARVTASFPGTLVMLCVLIAMVTQVIGQNVALAFSLVGALSIVRFRTVVQDTKDTAFVIFSVAVGMAIGAGQPVVGLGGMAAAGLVAWLFRDGDSDAAGRRARPYDLTVRMATDGTAEPQVRVVLARHGASTEPIQGGTAKKGTALRVVYRTRVPIDASTHAIIRELAAITGVQAVTLRRTKTDT